jgi:Fe-S-cluster containining protein
MELNIPDGINYECTGCGKCCSGWSVPLTQDDYDRISAYNWAEIDADFEGKNLFRKLRANEKLNTPYSHAINANSNGHCPFLKNNLCFIHSKFGAAIKPAICKLFPYSFNETPSGVFATVSFISRGAILNAGRPLLEQMEYLRAPRKPWQRGGRN